MTTFLELSPVSKIRRNHGLEHATIHMLSRRLPGKPMGGYSDVRGFFIYAKAASPELVCEAALEALQRMESGQADLAMHPGCGTNYLVSGIFAGTLAWLGVQVSRPRRSLDSLALAIMLATLGLIVSRPLGPEIQRRVTTSGVPNGLKVKSVRQLATGLFRVETG
jgi:hypothetical protein